jgi:hypothetical protein
MYAGFLCVNNALLEVDDLKKIVVLSASYKRKISL